MVKFADLDRFRSCMINAISRASQLVLDDVLWFEVIILG